MCIMPSSTTVSVPEAARLLGCHRDSLYRAIKAGEPIASGNGVEVYAITIGGTLKVSRAQLDALLGVAS